MGSVIMIHRRLGDHIEHQLYGKPDDVPLEMIIDPTVLWSADPKVYLTGLGAVKTQKRIAALLAQIDPEAEYRLERRAPEDVLMRPPGLTASSRVQGRVMPKYGNGG